MSGTSPVEKKGSGRTLAITLGIICILLAVGLVGVVANYTLIISGKDNTIASKDSEIANKNSQITDKDSLISSLNSQISSKDSLISSLNYQVNDLTDMVNLAKSEVWINSQTVSNPASSYVYWTFTANYAGYVYVSMSASTTTNSYVRVIYSSHGVNYDNQIGVVAGGAAVFPILPSTSIEIRIGNTNLFNGATETVTITYHY